MQQSNDIELSARLEALEAQTRQLSRGNRLLTSLLVVSLGIGLFLGIGRMPAADAQQARYLMGSIGQSLQDIEKAEMNRISPEEAKEEAQFAELMKRARRSMIQSGRIDSGLASAVALQEIREDLASVPQMAADMRQINAKLSAVPMMSTQLEDITLRLNVMTGTMDSTMGRAGRMMNWFWPYGMGN